MKTLFKGKHTRVIEDKGLEMIDRPVASAVLAFDTNHNVIMVEQKRGSFGKLLEIPAGKVEVGEDPIDAGARELMEETGYKADTIEFLISYYPSVGYSNERIDVYLAQCGEISFEQTLDDGERIVIKKIDLGELENMIDEGKILDSKTIVAIGAYNRRRKLDEIIMWDAVVPL